MTKTKTAEDIARLKEIVDRLEELGVTDNIIKSLRAWIVEQGELLHRQS